MYLLSKFKFIWTVVEGVIVVEARSLISIQRKCLRSTMTIRERTWCYARTWCSRPAGFCWSSIAEYNVELRGILSPVEESVDSKGNLNGEAHKRPKISPTIATAAPAT